MDLKKYLPKISGIKKLFPEKIDFTNFANNFVDEMKSKSEEMGNFNILITGKTGVGKSSLINAIFRDNLADTGIGAPKTDAIKMITKKGVPIRIYDTVGLELDAERQEKVMAEINQLISETRSLGEQEVIHCIWYCINANSSRLEPVEEKFIKELAGTGVPVIIVLTKAFSCSEAKEFRKYIENQNLNARGVCAVLAHPYKDFKVAIKSYGLKELVNLTRLVISENAEEVFVAVQIADLSLKRKKANFYISAAVTLAAAQCVNPIPLSDAPILTGIQLTMMTSITFVYGVNLEKSDIVEILLILLSTQGVKIAGITLASFLKSIIGVGSVAGGAINIAVATTLTAALGKTYAYIMEEVVTKKLDINNMDEKKWKDSIKAIARKMKKMILYLSLRALINNVRF